MRTALVASKESTISIFDISYTEKVKTQGNRRLVALGAVLPFPPLGAQSRGDFVYFLLLKPDLGEKCKVEYIEKDNSIGRNGQNV